MPNRKKIFFEADDLLLVCFVVKYFVKIIKKKTLIIIKLKIQNVIKHLKQTMPGNVVLRETFCNGISSTF